LGCKKRNIPELIASGKVRLERTTVALSGRAVFTDVYRLNQLYQSSDSNWSIWTCDPGHGFDAVPEYDYFFAPRDHHWSEFSN
jgi:hypothetical protein